MTDFRPVLFIVGILLSTLALAMCLPAIVDIAVGNPDWQVFALAAMFTLFVGVLLLLTSQGSTRNISVRQAFVLTTACWVVIPTFGALPFAFAELDLDYTDAFFEAMSGVTTTGSTVLVGLDHAPPGILLWRALLQWLGGIGVIAMAIAVLPALQVGGMQLFRMESSEKQEKVLPRAVPLVTYIGIVYLTLTALIAFAYWLAGMRGFDAICHAMTTIATGGYSTHDLSIGHYRSPVIDTIAIVGMVAGAMPFMQYLRAIRGYPRAIFRDSQVHAFFGILLLIIAAMTAYLAVAHGMSMWSALRYAAFNVVSVMTGTGYATADFSTWGTFAVTCLFFTMFIGGCAGSTTCGIKVFRFQVLYSTASMQLQRLLRPHGVFIAYYNRRPVSDAITTSVMSFFFLYIVCFVSLALVLGLTGLDFLTAASSAATAISNVGPGLGPVVGPAGTFTDLSDAAKWAMAAGMLIGRLELFTVLVLLLPSFWRN